MLCLFPRSWSSTTGESSPVSPDHLPTYNRGGIACPCMIALRAVPKISQVPASKQTAQNCGQFAAWHSKRSHWLAELIPGSYLRSLGFKSSHSYPRLSSERPLHIVQDQDTIALSTITDTTKGLKVTSYPLASLHGVGVKLQHREGVLGMGVGLLPGQTWLCALGPLLLPPAVDEPDDGVAHPVCGLQDGSSPERPTQGKHVQQRTL